MSSMYQFKKWLFGGRQLHVQIMGGDEAGKSTLMYTFKNHGKAPSEFPSVLLGYDTVKVEYPIGWEFTLVDVWDGCSRFRMANGLFHFMTPETLGWVVHDCSMRAGDQGPIDAWIYQYIDGMKAKGAKYMWIIMNKQDRLAPDERAQTVAEHKALLEAVLQKNAAPAGIKWFFVDEPGFNLLDGKFISVFIDNFKKNLSEIEKAEKLKQKRARDEVLEKSLSDEVLRARLELVQSPSSNLTDVDQFWDNFMQAELTSWSHVDHLEAGYLVLLRAIEEGHGMLKSASIFLEHLARLKDARPDIFRNTAHFTMTAFWLIQLCIAAFNFQYDINDGVVPVGKDFRAVLLNAPTLLDTKLCMQYYTKEVLFGPKARANFVMPDVKPFPQVTKPLLKSLADGKDELDDDYEQVLVEEEDLEAQERFLSSGTGLDRVPRWAFTVMQHVMANNLRRGKAVKEALAEFQRDTFGLRARHPKLVESGEIPPYSETQSYFWIQYTHTALTSLSGRLAKEQGGPGCLYGDLENIKDLTYERFKELCGVDGLEWKEFYTEALWESVEARIEFANPDKKPLPDVIQVH